MNLPQLTAEIGAEEKERIAGENELAMLVQPLNVNADKQGYFCFFTLDLVENKIRMEELTPFDQKHLYKYNYFGNNSAAGLQYYPTRKIGNSLHYLLTSGWSDLGIALRRNGLVDGQLFQLLCEAEKHGLIVLNENKGKGTLKLNKFDKIDTSDFSVDMKKKKINIRDQSYSPEAFARFLLQIESKSDELTIVVPRIRASENESPVVISQHPDFIAVTKKEQNLEAADKKEKTICFVCQQERGDTSSSATSKFSRSGINKIFTTTTINSSRNLDKKNFDDNYSICTDCFQNLLFGERAISANFRTQIAGEGAFIIPEAIRAQFEYKYIYKLKNGIDIAFNQNVFETWEEQLEEEQQELMMDPTYVVHFVIFRTDGNSITVLEAFEDVPTLRLKKVIKTLGWNASLYSGLRSMNLGNIYGIIPVRTNKNGDQLDVQRVLSIYRSLFSNHLLEIQIFFEYAMEAIEKGINRIRNERFNQYTNLSLKNYRGKEDYYIKDIVMKYLCLMYTCQQLDILDHKPFLNREVIQPMDQTVRENEIERIESFLTKQGFDQLPRALFYLGTLVRQVAFAQYKKGHKSKPILNKIQFQGMNNKEILWLYQEVLEKLRQYNKMTYLNEKLIAQFNHHYGSLKETEELTEQANIFYVMSGYAYMVNFPFEKREGNGEGTEQN